MLSRNPPVVSSHRQGQKVATCLFITSPRSSETRSSCKCSCLLATSSLPKSLWTERLIRANVSVSQNKKWIVLGGGGWRGGGGQSTGNKHNQNKHARTDSSHRRAWRCTGWDGKWTRPSPKNRTTATVPPPLPPHPAPSTHHRFISSHRTLSRHLPKRDKHPAGRPQQHAATLPTTLNPPPPPFSRLPRSKPVHQGGGGAGGIHGLKEIIIDWCGPCC